MMFRSFLRRLYSHGSACLIVGLLLLGMGLQKLSFDLPPIASLVDYTPHYPNRFYASNGTPLDAGQGRFTRHFVPLHAVPLEVQQAFIAAEDQRFYAHPGVDIIALLRAVLSGVHPNMRIQGASTITQQLVKNTLLSPERTLLRKIREMVLAIRVEQALSKTRILELYLNEIYFGKGAYGLRPAARRYFGKDPAALSLEEGALLAALPKAPSNLNPFANPTRVLTRRNWVLHRMQVLGLMDPLMVARATKKPLTLAEEQPWLADEHGQHYFLDTARKQTMGQLAASGIQGADHQGLRVVTTLDVAMQRAAHQALTQGLETYDRAKGWRGPIAQIAWEGAWLDALKQVEASPPNERWLRAVILGLAAGAEEGLRVGVENGEVLDWSREEYMWSKEQPQMPAPGDVVWVEAVPGDGAGYALRQVPAVQGALVAMDAASGQVRALVGGYDYASSVFNRAVDAKRQPGSAFKPFIYLTALEEGYRPSDRIADEPIDLPHTDGTRWSPRNHNGRFHGPVTLRFGLEQSVNVTTVHLARHLGMARILETAARFGVAEDAPPTLATALGAHEMSLMELVSAYAGMVAGGKRVRPEWVERLYYRERPIAWARPALQAATDPQSAFQLVQMLRGVVERGTAEAASVLAHPLIGKTGTTNQSMDGWFVAATPDLVVGVWMGYDLPQSLGKKAQGASTALPIAVRFLEQVLPPRPRGIFKQPEGLEWVYIDQDSGFLPAPHTPRARRFLEVFKQGNAPTTKVAKEQALPVLNVPHTQTSLPLHHPATRGTGGWY